MSDGAWYYQPEKAKPVEIVANPPYELGCGTGAFLLNATVGQGKTVVAMADEDLKAR